LNAERGIKTIKALGFDFRSSSIALTLSLFPFIVHHSDYILGPPTTPERIAMFQERLAKWAPGRTDLKTLWDLTDLDDRKSFGQA